MADRVIHISEAEAAQRFRRAVGARACWSRSGIENGNLPVAVIHAPLPERRTLSKCIALLPEDSTATIDADFAKDVEATVNSHPEPLTPPAWE